jgi:eukaryotic-like serine/threonine-protein kinase
MALEPGARLGPYEIVSPAGAGGMGEVYRARDTRLDRTVALKVLPPDLTNDPAARQRFEREARAVAALSHPHICTLHDIGQQDGTDFLVMEYLDGETLAARLARGKLPLDQALHYGIQIADALAAAHRAGIIHRDLKPGNIMLAKSGAKLLDFGLAKPQAVVTDQTQTRLAEPLTGHGVILGTLQYMAPEQLEGREASAQSDLFSFGAVLYEMVVGRRAFDGDSQAAVISSILRSEPPVATGNRNVDRLLTRLLRRDSAERWHCARDVALLLRTVATDQQFEPTPVAGHSGRRALWLVAGVILAAAVILIGLRTLNGSEPDPFVLALVPPARTVLTPGEAPQVSPDGRLVAFVATDSTGTTRAYVRSLDSFETRPLPETDDATQLFWSPDSKNLGFFARGALKTIVVAGGRPRSLAAALVPRGGTWSNNGVILFVPNPSYAPMQVPAGGGEARWVPVEKRGDHSRWFPQFLPDGRRYLYLATGAQILEIRLASIDSGDTKTLVKSATSAVYVPPGLLLYRRDKSIVAQRLNAETGELSQDPWVVAPRVGIGAISRQALFSAAGTGVLVLREADTDWQLVWFDRMGRRLGTLGSRGQYNNVCLSSDGKRVISDRPDIDTGNVDVWSLDVHTAQQTRLTFEPALDMSPVCSAKQDEVIFGSTRVGVPDLFRQQLASPGGEQRVRELAQHRLRLPTSWSRDGQLLAFSSFSPENGWDVWVMRLAQGEAVPAAITSAEERNGQLSPDAKWIAYTAQEGDTPNVFVQPFPPTGARWQVSRGAGTNPLWIPDGRQIYYLSASKTVMAVAVSTSEQGLSFSEPTQIVAEPVALLEGLHYGSPFAVTADGQQILMGAGAESVSAITLVRNWVLGTMR